MHRRSIALDRRQGEGRGWCLCPALRAAPARQPSRNRARAASWRSSFSTGAREQSEAVLDHRFQCQVANKMNAKSPTSSEPTLLRIGVEGLDDILGGGLTANRLYLLE